MTVRAAIHQPNFFPRLSTLAKIYRADVWVVLNDVQFARRDYQHRTRLAHIDEPARQQWLTLPVHLPHGRATRISQVRLVDVERSRRRVPALLQQHYGRSPHWHTLHDLLDEIRDLLSATDRLDDIAETSARGLLRLLGWRGRIVRSTSLPTRSGRSQRLADLSSAIGADSYLCGEGGLLYLDLEHFDAADIAVIPVVTPPQESSRAWTQARRISSLWALMATGPASLSRILTGIS